MNNFKPSPRPWKIDRMQRIDENAKDNLCVTCEIKPRSVIAEIYENTWNDNEAKSNACLISAAPELLKALTKFVHIDDLDIGKIALFANQGQAMDGYSKLANYQECIKEARKAITKAKGENNE